MTRRELKRAVWISNWRSALLLRDSQGVEACTRGVFLGSDSVVMTGQSVGSVADMAGVIPRGCSPL